jgi:hypothetical protein
MAQHGPNMPQHGPAGAPALSSMAPCTTQNLALACQGTSEHGPSMAQRGRTAKTDDSYTFLGGQKLEFQDPNMAQHGPSMAQPGPSMAQHRSSMAEHVPSTT